MTKMTEKDIKPIPKYILERMKKADKKANVTPAGKTRFYAYLAIWKKELVKVTVAVKYRYKKWLYKQVAVHGVHSDICYIKDMAFYYIAGYIVGWFEQGVGKEPKWFESPDWGWQEDKYFDPYAPIVNRELIDKLPEYKYSAYTLYSGVDLLQYLRLYEKYPQTEYLLKLGLNGYVHSKQILEKMGKDKNFCKWLAKNREDLSHNNYYIATILKAYTHKTSAKQIQNYEETKKHLKSHRHYRLIKELFNNNLDRFLTYIAKQNTNLGSYSDYIDACLYFGLNMSEKKNYIPHDFQRWHDIRIDEYRTAKAMKDEQERKELIQKFSLVASKYTSLQHCKGGFICIIAKSPQDLIYEGEVLHHCVGRMNYDQRFIREESLIFFVRNEQTPETPFVTVEYSLKTKKVLQCYGDSDTKPDAQVLNYVNKVWLPYANRHLKQIAA